jgi:KEOPS complex subunit Cgi121
MMPSQSEIKIIGCRGEVQSSELFLKKAHDFVKDPGVLLQFLNADYVLGEEHVLSAYEHAKRAFDSKKNISKSLAMEILVYVSGEPQIANALEMVGIKDGCESIVLVVDGKLDAEELVTHLNLKMDNDVLKCDKKKLENFGIGKPEISAVDKDKIKDLILERVAMVDVRK